MSSTAKRKQMLSPNTIVKKRWEVGNKIGQGAFGETYAAYDLQTNKDVAIKVEKLDNKKMILKLEVIALKRVQTCPFVVRYIYSGRQDDFNFLVMERLGDNLAELKKHVPRMIESLEGVHKLGYIHRDVKPSNYVIGRTKSTSNRAYIIDFGLARKFILQNGDIRPARKSAGFRGTARYASINSHKLRELGRRDDLWSVFYVLVEFVLGSLPWKKIKDKEMIGELKEKLTNADLVKDLPTEFQLFMDHLYKLSYADEPDYDYLKGLLNSIAKQEGISPDDPWDWNLVDSDHIPPQREIQSIMDEPMVTTNPSKSASTKVVSSNRNEENFYSIYQPSDGNNNNGNRRHNSVSSKYQPPDVHAEPTSCHCNVM